MKEKTQYLSKDVLDAEKVNNNIDSEPQVALTELARVLNLNIQAAQLNDMKVETAMDICTMIKASANITLAKWAMKSKRKELKSLRSYEKPNET